MTREKGILFVACMVLLIGILDYTTAIHKSSFDIVYRELYLIPIFLGAYWFGRKGGMICSVAASAIYLPCVLLTAPSGSALYVSNLVEMFLFNAVAFIYGTLRDRERKQKEEKLEVLMAMAGGVAHELNNPLAIAIMDAEMVQQELGPGSEHYGDLQAVVRNLKRMADVIKKMTGMKRIEMKPYVGKENIIDFERSSEKVRTDTGSLMAAMAGK